jgi:hypothetical protein
MDIVPEKTSLLCDETVRGRASFRRVLKSLEFNHRPRGGFGIGISMKVEGRPHPIRFQSIGTGMDRVREQFGVDMAAAIDSGNWARVLRAFQKRHLLAHKMGVVDADYLTATGDAPSQLGRRISTTGSEVRELVSHLQSLAETLFRSWEAKP